jgi:hypothetical protein
MSDNKKFKFPDSVLDKVNECSNGGYILFTINQEGLPEVFSDFDDPTKAMALQYYIDQWSRALTALNVDLTTQQIMGEDEDPDDLPPEV